MSAQQIAGVMADLHLLTILADTRSFTQTARQLGVSKSSVSMRIKDLERAAGTALVRRTTRSITLTQAGLQLVDDIRGSFARIEQGFANVRDLVGSPRGLVRMSAPVALGRQAIAPTLPEFLQRFPEIRLELDLSDRFVNLTQEGYDLAVRHTSTVPESHVATVLCDSQALLMASPDYLRRRGVPQSPADLGQHDCLLYLRDGGAPSWSFTRPAGRKRLEQVTVPVGGPFKANNSEVLRAAVLGGLGIGLLPDFSVWGAPAERPAGGVALAAGRRAGQPGGHGAGQPASHAAGQPAGHADFGDVASAAMVRVLSDWKPVGFFGERLYALRPWAPRAPRAVQCVIDHLRQIFAGGFRDA